jgi:uncharacterized protein YukE
MSGERDYMNHNSMDAMAKAFVEAERTLEATISEMDNIAKAMDGGALVGLGGQAFADALNNKLKKRLNVLKTKMHELHKDIKDAQQANREAEGTAKGRFQ